MATAMKPAATNGNFLHSQLSPQGVRVLERWLIANDVRMFLVKETEEAAIANASEHLEGRIPPEAFKRHAERICKVWKAEVLRRSTLTELTSKQWDELQNAVELVSKGGHLERLSVLEAEFVVRTQIQTNAVQLLNLAKRFHVWRPPTLAEIDEAKASVQS
ncbi:MAG: hypothetical protein JNM43_07595 [Planctomycetaceae bacterium]|nr:hypothetical protein [Planctomycetaceae bacterium]